MQDGVFVKTFGCQMNEYDSEKMLSLLAADYQPVSAMEEARVVIVNTCSVREKGEHKLYSLLGSLRDEKRERPELIIGVSGCVAQQEGSEVIKRFPAVDFVVGTHNLSLVPSLVAGAKLGRRHQVAIDYREDWEQFPDVFFPETGISGASSFEGQSSLQGHPFIQGHRALVAIQRGCNKNCAFCVVPNTRGPEVSREAQEILREIRLKVRLGAKEVLLLGQTVNSWGRDLSPRYPFEELIRKVAEIEGVKRIRFISPHPAEVKPAFIELYGQVPQLCPHIHLPLQSGSDRILKLMNRNYRTKRYLEIVEALRKRLPEIAITTDLIVGFPTESAEDFEDTLKLMREVSYNMSFSFKYSRRPNTKADMEYKEEEEVPEDIKHARLLQLQQVQDEIGLAINKSRLGQIVEVLVDEVSLGDISSTERSKGRIAENTIVELVGSVSEPGAIKPGAIKPGSVLPGSLVRAKIVHASSYGLRGEVVS